MKKFLSLMASLFTCCFYQIAIAQSLPNAIIPDYAADPSVVSFNGMYYLYGTSDIDHGLRQMGPPVVWVSADLVHWSYRGTMLPGIDFNKPYPYTDSKGASKTGFFRYWAPGKVLYRDQQYYLYATIVKPDEQLGTYLLLADQPEGPFHFANGTGLYFNQPGKAADEAKPVAPDIDGDTFVDDDGSAYLVWRRRMAGKLSADWKSLDGAAVSITTKRAGYSEGPFLFKRKGIYYYVYTLSGNANYCYAYMMSKISALGPYTAPQGEDIILKSNIATGVWGPGHGNVLQIPGSDNYLFFYLEYGLGSTTRQVFANQLFFNADGTIKPVRADRTGIASLVKSHAPLPLAVFKVSASGSKSDTIIKANIDTGITKLANIGGRFSAGPDVIAVQRLVSFKPENAADGLNGTCWMAAKTDTMPWYQVDLGAVKNINSCAMFFVASTLGHAWKLEKSKDGKTWETVKTQTEPAVLSPHVVSKIGRARYLKLSITAGVPGLWEMKVY